MENTWLYLAHNCPDHPDRGIRITEGSLTLLYKQTDILIRVYILILHFNKRIGSK